VQANAIKSGSDNKASGVRKKPQALDESHSDVGSSDDEQKRRSNKRAKNKPLVMLLVYYARKKMTVLPVRSCLCLVGLRQSRTIGY